MKLIPAIDLKDNKCVRLSEGKEDTSLIFNDNPVDQARYFEDVGCKRIHIVDLDAAFGRSEINKKTILEIRNNTSIDIELGGGIRSEKEISFWLNNKINFLIIGSLASQNSSKTKKLCNKYPNKIYIALDDLNGKLMIHGWVNQSQKNTNNIIEDFNDSQTRGFIFTDISRDGMLSGINIDKISQCLSVSKKTIIVSGGLTNYQDLKNLIALENKNLEGVIMGKSFYLGKIDIKKGQELLNNNA